MINDIKTYTLAIAVVFVSVLFISQASYAQPYTCLPNCNTTDARFLVLSGVEVFSLNHDSISFGIRSPGENAEVEIGIFDGDQGNSWDFPDPGADLEFTLFADPNNDGSGNVQVGQWLGDTMPDGDWFIINQPNNPAALAADGDYIYKFTVRNLGPNLFSWNLFKLRTDGNLRVLPFEIFSFISTFGTPEDFAIVYPSLAMGDPSCFDGPDLCERSDPDCCLHDTTYDGNWTFHFIMPEGVERLEMFDGDFDYGSSMLIDPNNGTCAPDGGPADTDDPNTPNDEIFPWAETTEVVFEGAALGSPFDDRCLPIPRRPPSVFYSLVGPEGSNLVNDNPSGTAEWERFSITTGPLDPTVDDLTTPAFEPGSWEIRVFGLDQSNLNVIRFPYAINGVDENENPVPFDPEPEVVRNVPTMSEWGMLAFVMFALLASVYYLRNRRINYTNKSQL